MTRSNDLKEGDHITDVFKSVWDQEFSHHQDHMGRGLLYDQIKRLIQRDDDHPSGIFNKTAFVFSMSEEGDLLSQWRGYGDDGCGVAIGFKWEALNLRDALSSKEKKRILTMGDDNYRPKEVVYDEGVGEYFQDIIGPINEYLQKNDHFPNWNFNMEENNGEDLLHLSKIIYRPERFLIKHPAFKEEKEWRLVLVPTVTGRHPGFGEIGNDTLWDYVQYNMVKTGVVQYLEVALHQEALAVGNEGILSLSHKGAVDEQGKGSIISQVVLGPKNSSSTIEVEAFLKQRGFGGVEVIRSKAPYI